MVAVKGFVVTIGPLVVVGCLFAAPPTARVAAPARARARACTPR